MLPFTKKSCAAAEMSDRRLYLTCRLTTGRGLNVRVTSLHRNEHVSNSFSLFLFPFFLENFSAFESYRNLDSFLVTRSFHDLLKGEKLYNEKLKSEKLINEKFVVVEREYRGLEIESEERACIYIYIYNMSIRRKVHPRLAIQNGKKARNTDARMVQIVRR